MPESNSATMSNGSTITFTPSGDTIPAVTASSISQWYSQPYYLIPQPVPRPEPATVGTVAEPESKAIELKTIEDVDTLREHVRLCAKLSIYSPAAHEIKRVEFDALLSEMGVRLYDQKQVKTYLDALYGPPIDTHNQGVTTATWGYRPLTTNIKNNVGLGRYITQNGYVGAHGELEFYTKAVPLPVLLTVERVLDKFPDAQCFVSDNLTQKEVSDPFLLVRFAGKDYIIERWDEPNYKER